MENILSLLETTLFVYHKKMLFLALNIFNSLIKNIIFLFIYFDKAMKWIDHYAVSMSKLRA